MKVEIINRPANSVGKVSLGPNESFISEAGAMVAMSGDTRVNTITHKRGSQGGGILKAMKRLLAGESFFVNEFTAGANGGDVYIAPNLSGDMTTLEIKPGETMIVQGGSFMACDPKVNIDLNFGGLKNLFSGEGLFWIQVTGEGQMVMNSFGAIYPIDIDGEHIVDTGHIVAFPSTVNFKVVKANKSLIGSLLGGEGLVCKFTGKGRIWCQSHNAAGFGKTLGPLLRPREA